MKYNPKSIFQALLLKKSLASESQMNEEIVIDLANGKAKRELRVAEQIALEYGGEAKDWTKKGSSSFTASDGTQFETHWYENKKIGLKVEFKTKLT